MKHALVDVNVNGLPIRIEPEAVGVLISPSEMLRTGQSALNLYTLDIRYSDSGSQPRIFRERLGCPGRKWRPEDVDSR